MREIKFRGKRIDNGSWVYGHYFKSPLTDENSGTSPDVGWFFLSGETRHCIVQDGVSFVIDERTLGEYTGIKDCKNAEIYEGDLLKISITSYPRASLLVEKSLPVEYRGCKFGVNWKDEFTGLDGFSMSVVTFEVVGNIYQHGHLLT